jgi:hypothetical protein
MARKSITGTPLTDAQRLAKMRWRNKLNKTVAELYSLLLQTEMYPFFNEDDKQLFIDLGKYGLEKPSK